ncbi:unnamed protein product [Prunus brigantina]
MRLTQLVQKQRREVVGNLAKSNLYIGSPLTHLGRELHSTEVSQDIDGLVDMRPIFGTTVARRKGKPEKDGKVGKKKLHQS